MNKLNCWEYMKCGYEIGGHKANDSDVCPVAAETSASGMNGGDNGGRLCWLIANNCNQDLLCSGSSHKSSCCDCEFKTQVFMEEGLLNVCKSTGWFIQLTETSTK